MVVVMSSFVSSERVLVLVAPAAPARINLQLVSVLICCVNFLLD